MTDMQSPTEVVQRALGDAQGHGNWIGGRVVVATGDTMLEVRNPLDDQVIGCFGASTVADMGKAVDAAATAAASFSKSLAKDREAILMSTAALLEERSEIFAELLVDEIGSPIAKARYEVSQGVVMLRAAAGGARRVTGQTMPSDKPSRLSLSFRAPLGSVGVITPFNVPIIKGARLIGNALAAGNTVVHLPSEFAPFTALALARLFDEAGLPAGALNVVVGRGDEIGDSLVLDPRIAAVSFTGSTRVGKHIAELCGKHMKRVVLELGGKSPLVILDDADLDAAVKGAIFGIFMYQGQVCMGSSRIYVQTGIYEQFVERFAAASRSLGIGDMRDPSTMIGPIISDRQRARVRAHIENALEAGATAVVGGDWSGNRCTPTILTNVTRDMTCYHEETFGPVAAVYPIADLDEAIRLSNDSAYGLSSAIYTDSLNSAFKYVAEVRAGMVHVNAPTLHDEPNVPFGGVGDSGFGREGVDEDIATLTEWKWATVQLNA